MIRLPTLQERAKIATPNKAGTLLGVSPFSSVRNVMAKVQDTSCDAPDARSVRKYKTIPCKGCGGPVRTSLKKPYCSHECRNKHKLDTFEWKTCGCAACGKQVTKKVYFKYPQNALVCSTECQRVWAGMCGKGVRTDWVARSKKAKLLWKKQHSRLRCAESASLEAVWWNLCYSKQLLSKQLSSQWAMRCASSASGLRQRLVVSTVLKRSKKSRTWQKLCRFTVVKKIDYASMEGWAKKCYSVCKNMKWKRRLRNVRQNIWKPTNKVEVVLRQLGFWE